MRQLVAITDAAPIGDDVVALAMLAHAREADFALAIATSGNVWAEEAATNVRRVLTHVGRDDIPVLIDRSRHPRLGPGRMQHESVGGANAVYRGALDHPRPPLLTIAQN